MKIAQKVYIFTLILYFITFHVAGIVMIEQNYQKALNSEINRGKNEHLSIESGVYASMPAYETLGRYVDVMQYNNKILSTFAKDYLGKSKAIYLEILDMKNKSIFSNISFMLPKKREELDLKNPGIRKWIIRDLGKNLDKTYLFVTNVIELNNTFYKLTYVRDISSVYKQRKDQYAFFMKLDGIVFVIFSIFMYWISKFITKPIQQLIKVTQRIAQGEYHEKIQDYKKDELGVLAEHFNVMADAVKNQIVELERMNGEKQRFIENFTHELKTPLTSIIGYSNLLRTTKCDEKTYYSAVDFIYNEGKRLEALSFKLMDLILLKKDSFHMKIEDVKKIAEEVQENMALKMKKKNIQFVMTGKSVQANVEKDLLKIVLLNLVDNAYKASKENTKIKMHIKEDHEWICVQIKDYGIGIPKEHLDKILEPFYMVDKARTRANNGAGLGLSICKNIMDIHNGTLKFYSEEQRGTTIDILLPKPKEKSSQNLVRSI